MPRRAARRWFVYMLECERDTLYTGVAVDVAARYAQHACGKGAAYTRAYKPIRIVAQLRCADRGAALRKEAALKKLTRAQKLAWAARRAAATASRRIHRENTA